MPIIKIHLVEGRTLEQKEKLIENVTKAVKETINCDISTIRIIIDEMKPEHLGIGGITIKQRNK